MSGQTLESAWKETVAIVEDVSGYSYLRSDLIHRIEERHAHVLKNYQKVQRGLEKNWDRDHVTAAGVDRVHKLHFRRRVLLMKIEEIGDKITWALANDKPRDMVEAILGRKLVRAAAKERELWTARDRDPRSRFDYLRSAIRLYDATVEFLEENGRRIRGRVDHSIAWGDWRDYA